MTVLYEVSLPHCFSVLVKSVDDPVRLRQGFSISSWFVYELFCVKNGPKPMFLRGVPMIGLGLFGLFNHAVIPVSRSSLHVWRLGVNFMCGNVHLVFER